MSIVDFLSPVPQALIDELESSSPRSWFRQVSIYSQAFPAIEEKNIWLLGVQEDRGMTVHQGAAQAPDAVRKELYRLLNHQGDISLADLGNLKAGNSLGDTYFALQEVQRQALEQKKLLLIIGGSADLAYAAYKAYEQVSRTFRLVCIDSKIELGKRAGEEEDPYLGRIILHEPNYLFNISQLGYQTYFCEQESLDTFNRMNFDAYRLGHIRKNMDECEPLLRDADMCIFNMGAIRQGEAPAQGDASPNGLFGDEACQLARYAGLSNELSCMGFYNMNPAYDQRGQSAKLLAQMIWYFVDGYQHRKYDYPATESSNFQTYRITFNNSSHEVVFHKSLKSDRWWMEVPYPVEKSGRKGNYLVPCSYRDYETACNDEVPDRWMKTYYKLI